MAEEKKQTKTKEVEETPKKEEVLAETKETPGKEEVLTETEETPGTEEDFVKVQLKSDIPDIRAGDMVRIHQKIRDKNKERIQIFEGQILFMKHGKGISGTMTVRKVTAGIGIEKTFQIHSPLIEKIELVKELKARRAKLYYLRDAKGRKARLKAGR